MRPDVLLLVPFQPGTGTFMDPQVRRTSIAHVNLPILEARSRLEAWLGRSVGRERWRGPSRVGHDETYAHRSATSVVLATHLERAGLRWRVIDPGVQELSYWRARVREARAAPPRVVAISTTFVVSAPWLRRLCEVVRAALPRSALVVGGYYYASSASEFLSLPADVLCVGEGEERLPAIVRAIRDGEALSSIPGLYLRREDGSLESTGRAEPLSIEALPIPDWTLAPRIEPPAHPARHGLVYVAETQRGCIFKCEYCTYRTLAELDLASVEHAARTLLEIAPRGASAKSQIDLVDPTGTYPPERWEAILHRLIAAGGAPHPISTYARVSDVDEGIAELMERAGVRRVFIGQESGHQGMLNRMKKGTRVDQVRPAVHALGRHGIDPILSFIHGFPGETMESLEATRRMIADLNEGFDGPPACALYRIEPFALYDFASVSKEAPPVSHYLGYASTGALSTRAVLDEVLRTITTVSRSPSAPVCESLLDWMGFDAGAIKERLADPATRAASFRWLKALERGVALFLEAHLDGASPDPRALERVGEVLGGRSSSFSARATAELRRRAARRLARECAGEERRGGPGPLTRALLGGMALRDTRDPRAFLDAVRGEAPAPRSREPLGQELVSIALTPRRGAAAIVQRAKREAIRAREGAS